MDSVLESDKDSLSWAVLQFISSGSFTLVTRKNIEHEFSSRIASASDFSDIMLVADIWLQKADSFEKTGGDSKTIAAFVRIGLIWVKHVFMLAERTEMVDMAYVVLKKAMVLTDSLLFYPHSCFSLRSSVYRLLSTIFKLNAHSHAIVFEISSTNLSQSACSFSCLAQFLLSSEPLNSPQVTRSNVLQLTSKMLFPKSFDNESTIDRSTMFRCFSSSIRLVSSAEFLQFFLPDIERCLKRNTSILLSILSSRFFLPHAKIEVGVAYKNLILSVSEQLLSKDDIIGSYAVSTLVHLASKISEPELLSDVVMNLVSMCSTKLGKPKRNILLTVVSNIGLHISVSDASHSVVASKVVSQLFAILSSESKPSSKTLDPLIDSMIIWCKPLDSLPSNLIDFVISQFDSKKCDPTLKNGVYRMASGLCGQRKFISQLSDLSPFCEQHLKKPVAILFQPLNRSSFIYSLHVSMSLLSLNTFPETELLIQLIESSISDEEFISKVDNHEQLRIIETVMLAICSSCISSDKISSFFCSLNSLLLDRCVNSQVMISNISSILRNDDSLCSIYIESLCNSLRNHPPISKQSKFILADLLVKISPYVLPVLSLYETCLFFILMGIPSINRFSKSIYSDVIAKLKNDLVQGSAQSSQEVVLALIESEFGLFSESLVFSDSSLVFLSIVWAWSQQFSGLRSEIILASLNRLNDDKLSKLSEYETQVFRTPEGSLCEISSDVNLKITGKKNDKRKETDEEWERRVAEELLQKETHAGLVTQQLKSESEIRKKIRSLRHHHSIFLRFIARIIERCSQTFCKESLSMVYFKICSMSILPTIEEEVGHVFLGLSTLLSSRLCFKMDIIHCLLMCIRSPIGIFNDVFNRNMISVVLDSIVQSFNAVPFTESTFFIIFPILETFLLSRVPKGFPISKHLVFSLVCAHVSQICTPSMIRKVFHLLTYILNSVHNLRAQASESIEILGSSFSRDCLSYVLNEGGLLHPSIHVRQATLKALLQSNSVFQQESKEVLCSRIWLLQSDSEESVDCTLIAQSLWYQLSCEYSESCTEFIVKQLSSEYESIRNVAAKSISEAIRLHDISSSTLPLLFHIFENNKDKYVTSAFQREPSFIDFSHFRQSILYALELSSPYISQENLLVILNFLLEHVVSDQNPNVWDKGMALGLATIDACGTQMCDRIISIVEMKVEALQSSTCESTDQIQEASVILMGNAAKHLEKTNPKVISVLSLLLDVLQTPSYNVQLSASECISDLVTAADETLRKSIISDLLNQLSHGKSYGDRKGASFGIAGVVKGLRVSSLKKYGIMTVLLKMLASTDSSSKQGSLFAFDALFSFIGFKFEPYVVHILPHLLSSFSDSNPVVREATQEACRTIMGNLTSHGVKMILPLITSALDEPQWRTKVESINMLGAMAFCAPHQLSSSLPIIVPQLMDILRNPHQRVQQATQSALRDIGSVVQNPEIQELVPIILDALFDPTSKTEIAMQALIDTSFSNAVDTPALALIVPILHRGLRDRSGSTKRMAAQIVGSLCSFLRNTSDLVPYLDSLVEELKTSLVDPYPDVRAASAKAIGELFKGMGYHHITKLIEWLVQKLEGETTQVERSGGAQALSELVASLGNAKFESYFERFLIYIDDVNPAVRDAFITVFSFLPRSFGSDFVGYLDRCLPPLISCFADDKGSIRNASMNACKSIVDVLGPQYPLNLLQHFSETLLHDNWRIREASIVLVGDVLHRVVGHSVSIISGEQIEFDDDETTKHENEELIEEALGIDVRDRVFSLLYILQSDIAPNVKQMAWLVWKSLVYNTTKLLGSILNVFIKESMRSLTSGSKDLQDAAAKSLGELIHRTGRVVIPVVLPILIDSMDSSDDIKREGAGIALSEIISSASKNVVNDEMSSLIKPIRKGLGDPYHGVRVASALAFDSLFRSIGKDAVAKVIPHLLNEMSRDSANSENILEGIKQVMKLRSGHVLNHLVPFLLETPNSTFSIHALSSLAGVSGDSLFYFIDSITNALLNVFEKYTVDQILGFPENVESFLDFGLHLNKKCLSKFVPLLSEYLVDPTHPSSGLIVSALIVGKLFETSTEIGLEMLNSTLDSLISLMIHSSVEVQQSALDALTTISVAVTDENLVQHVAFIRSCILKLAVDRSGRVIRNVIPGMSLNHGIKPFLPVYLHSLMYGMPKQREEAASGINELVRYTDTSSLGPYVIKITGPLIRIVGDRFQSSIKASILDTLSILLLKAGKFLRPFVPQLQTTFFKALSDESSQVRAHAAIGLGNLMSINMRKLNQLIDDLMSSVSSLDGSEFEERSSYLSAIENILLKVGESVALEKIEAILCLVEGNIFHENDTVRINSGKLFGVVSQYLDSNKTNNFISSFLSSSHHEVSKLHGNLCAVAGVCQYNFPACVEFLSDIDSFLSKGLSNGNVLIRETSVSTSFTILEHAIGEDSDEKHDDSVSSLWLSTVIGSASDSSSSVRGLFLKLFRISMRTHWLYYSKNIDVIAPTLVKLNKDPDMTIRVDSEKAVGFLLGGSSRNADVADQLIKNVLDPETVRVLHVLQRKLKYL